MVMVTGDDPVHGVHLLKDYIVHTHVKDGIRHQPVDPRDVYGAVGYQPLDHQRIAELVSSGTIFQEVPLGEGKVDFDAYFAALQESGYGGDLTIEREVGDAPERDIERAVSFIRQYR